MARLQMQKIGICALKKDRQALIEELQRKGAVQLVDQEPPEEGAFGKTNTMEQRSGYERTIQACKQALEVLDKYAPVKESPLAALEGRRMLSPEEWKKRTREREELEGVARQINALAKQAAENHTQAGRLQAQAQGLEPWMGLDLPLDFKGTKKTAAFIGVFAGERDEGALKEALAQSAPELEALDLWIISRTKEQTCVFVLCLKKDAQKAEDTLRANGFSLPGLPGDKVPAQEKEELLEKIRQCQERAGQNEEELRQLGSRREDLMLLMDDSALRAEQQKATDLSMASRHVFWLSGYLPAKRAKEIQSLLEQKYGAVVQFEEPGPQENVPVAVENGPFAAPVEGVLNSFSLPGKGEIDPTFMMSLFYYFFFGMMLSDAGYGLVMVLACGFCLVKYKNMEPSWKKTLKMFLYSGISAAFWGAMYGSWFGDAPKVIASTFFGSDFTIRPLWMDPLAEPMTLLMICMLFGIIHLFAGLGCKVYQSLRQKDYLSVVSDALVWYLLVGGLILFGLSSQTFVDMLQLDFLLPAAVGAVGKWMAILGALGVVICGGLGYKNPLLRLVNGLYALYGSTSWLGDILSYSRLLGLGLATGVIAQVVNMMGSMMGGGVLGAIVFILVFLLGHTMNIAINLLGAYVHTNRLEYVEFFGKFFEGGGEPFVPLDVHTKYYKISEVK